MFIILSALATIAFFFNYDSVGYIILIVLVVLINKIFLEDLRMHVFHRKFTGILDIMDTLELAADCKLIKRGAVSLNAIFGLYKEMYKHPDRFAVGVDIYCVIDFESRFNPQLPNPMMVAGDRALWYFYDSVYHYPHRLPYINEAIRVCKISKLERPQN